MPYNIPKTNSVVIAIKIEEFTLPFTKSKIPTPAIPNKNTSKAIQIYNLAFETGKLQTENIKTANPNINIEVLRTKTIELIVESNPKISIKETEKKKRCKNK